MINNKGRKERKDLKEQNIYKYINMYNISHYYKRDAKKCKLT